MESMSEKKMREAVVVAYGRTPYCKANKGSFANVHPVEYGAQALLGVLNKVPQLKPEDIGDVIVGCAMPFGVQGANMARLIVQRAGLPDSVTAQTVNRFCSSGLQTIATAANAIRCGEEDVMIAGGVESMSMVPMLVGVEDADPWLMEHRPEVYVTMGITAENVAARYHLSREELDAHAVLSQQRAAAALEAGVFDEEIVPVHVEQKKKSFDFARDEFPRPGTTMDVLGKLRPAFKKDGVVTAGNASGVNDGAAALVLMDAGLAAERGLSPLARIVGWASAGVEPDVMGLGPIPATRKALEKAGWTVADLDQIEANEAFAAQFLAVGRELGFSLDNVNINGGAIALGHPIGASGARILVTLLHTLKRKGQSRGLATLCIGGGQGIAMLVERG